MQENQISVLITEKLAEEGLAIFRANPYFKVDVCLGLNKPKLMEKVPFYDALLVRSLTKVDKEVINEGKKLKLIGRAGVGLDNIDIDTAKNQNIRVINTPLANSVAVAELCFGLMISLIRHIPASSNHLLEGKWDKEIFLGSELLGKTLGLIGFGNIARLVTKRAQAFDMNVIAYDPFVPDKIFKDFNVENGSLKEILAKADIVSLHCPLNADTKHLINDNTMKYFKPKSILINTARGELIDSKTLLTALDTDLISMAALDVYEIEPPPETLGLIGHKKVLGTPHIGALSMEAKNKVSTLLAEETIRFFLK